MTNLNSVLKSRDNCFADKGVGPYNQSYDFSSSHVWMSELDHKEGWVPKHWCSWNRVLEKTLESPLDSKEIKWVSPKGNQPWIFIGRTDAEIETPIPWPTDAKSWLIGNKTLMLGKIEGRRKSGWQRMRWLDSIIDSMDMSLSKLQVIVKDREVLQSMPLQTVGHDWATEQPVVQWLSALPSAGEMGSTPGLGRPHMLQSN